MKKSDVIDLSWNIEIVAKRSNGQRVLWHQRTHNIVVNTGRQFFCEALTASAWAGAGFTRTDDSVVRYMGFGIGGAMQTNPSAAAPPYSSDYDYATVGTHNTQLDTDVTVAKLERPVQVSAGVWLKEVTAPGTFPNAYSVAYVGSFTPTDISYGGYSVVPLSEIGLYKSSADPLLANGSAGAYPGGTGHLIAYDTFTPFPKSGIFGFEVTWTLVFG